MPPGAPQGRPPRRCLRSQPEPECPGRAARARRRSAADSGRAAGRLARRARPRRAARSRQYRRRQQCGDGRRPPPRNPNAGGLTTLPPSATPKDEFDLGIGYMQRKDYALAEETMRNFAQKYPSDPLTADAQYWLGESFFQRQQYRDAAEAFLGVTTKFDKSAKAPGCPAAARAIAGGAEGEGGRLRRLRRGDAEISARLQRRQGGRRPRAEAGEVLRLRCLARRCSWIASRA